LRVLVRSPLLLGVLIAYPLLAAGLVGLVAGYGSSKPRVALVDEDHLPQVVTVGGQRFRIQDAIDEVGKNVHLVRMDAVPARRALATGRVVATLTVPPGFLADLRSGLHSPSLVYQTTRGGISSRVTQQVQALVYALNLDLQKAYVQTDLGYVRLIVQVGDVVGGEPWSRLPLLAVGLVIAGAALGALGSLLGALARDSRSASLVAVLVVMPVVFVGLVPREVAPVAGWLSDGLPFVHAVRYFAASLYDASPWRTIGRELLWLAGLGAVFGTLARLATRRLLA